MSLTALVPDLTPYPFEQNWPSTLVCCQVAWPGKLPRALTTYTIELRVLLRRS